jgi:hypothetical protein
VALYELRVDTTMRAAFVVRRRNGRDGLFGQTFDVSFAVGLAQVKMRHPERACHRLIQNTNRK